ncbi:hypothetical protein ABH973_000168 [Bradyrhizobium ottawaense]
MHDQLRMSVYEPNAKEAHQALRARSCCLALRGQAANIFDSRRPEGIDGLGIIANDHDTSPVRFQQLYNLELQSIGVLKFVYQDVLEALSKRIPYIRPKQQSCEVNKQVVIVYTISRKLGLCIPLEYDRQGSSMPHQSRKLTA